MGKKGRTAKGAIHGKWKSLSVSFCHALQAGQSEQEPDESAPCLSVRHQCIPTCSLLLPELTASSVGASAALSERSKEIA